MRNSGWAITGGQLSQRRNRLSAEHRTTAMTEPGRFMAFLGMTVRNDIYSAANSQAQFRLQYTI